MTDQEAAFPRIGILRKGAKKPANGPGRDLTFFRFVAEDEDAQEHFDAAYPDEDALRSINVLLPFETPEENFIDNSWIEKWVAGGLEYRSDGKNLILWRQDNGQYSDDPKPDPKPQILEDGKRADGSMQVGRLTVIIPELGRLATVTILTTSKNDVINLSNQLKSYYAINGDLRGIPFVVVRRKHKISTPMGGGTRGRRDSWLLSIETQPHYTRLHLASVQRAALPAPVDFVDAEEVTENSPTIEVEKIPAPEEPPQPTQPKAAPPNSAESLLEILATKTDYYTNIYHLINGIRKMAGRGRDWLWPEKDDIDGWRDAYVKALAYANRPKEDDGNDWAARDKQAFYTRVIVEIPFFNDGAAIDKAMEELGIEYDVENEDFILDELAKFAGQSADLRIARQDGEKD